MISAEYAASCSERPRIAAVNAEEAPCRMDCAYHGPAVELLTGEKTDLHGTVILPASHRTESADPTAPGPPGDPDGPHRLGEPRSVGPPR